MFTIALCGLLLITLALHATADGQSSGLPVSDRIFASIRRAPMAPLALRIFAGLLAIGCPLYVFRTGDLGARPCG